MTSIVPIFIDQCESLTDIPQYKSKIDNIINDLMFNTFTVVRLNSLNVYSIIDWFAEHGVKFRILKPYENYQTDYIQLLEYPTISDKLFTYTNLIVCEISRSKHEEILFNLLSYSTFPIKYIATQFIDRHKIEYIESMLYEYGMITQTDQYINIIGFNTNVLPKFTLDAISDDVLAENIIKFMFMFDESVDNCPYPNVSFLEKLRNITHNVIIEILNSWILSYSYDVHQNNMPCIIFNILTDLGIKVGTKYVLDITLQNYVLDGVSIIDYIDSIRTLVIDKLENNFKKYLQKYLPNQHSIELHFLAGSNNPILIKFVELIKCIYDDNVYVTHIYDTTYIFINKFDTDVILYDDIILT